MTRTLLTPTLETLAAVEQLAPELAARAQEGEQSGTMPVDLVERLRSAGLFRLAQPRSLGGREIAPADLIRVVEGLSQADGSAGWTALIGIGANSFAGWLDPSVAIDLFGADADVTVATVFAPTGRAVPIDAGQFTVSGRWPFASGCRHADWFLNGVFVFDGDAPRLLPGRGPDWRLAYLPRHEAVIIDNWDVLGLRGTGSNDVAVAGATVADEHTISPFFHPAQHDGALWRLPFFTLAGIGLVGFPLGVARRALDEVTALAPTKTRAGTMEPLAADPAVQVALAAAEGALQAARSFVFDTVGSLWDTACAGDVPSVDQRARFQLAAQQAMHAAVRAVDIAFAATGASATYAGHPLQRCFRDIHTAAQHAYFSPAALKRFAKVRLGIDQPLHML